MKYLNGFLPLLAGLTGGVASHYLLPQAVQSLTPDVVAAKSFVLVDDKGKPAGVFAVVNPSAQCNLWGNVRCNAASIVLYDAQGRELWRASDAAKPLTVSR